MTNGCATLNIGMTIENGYIAPFHFCVFVNHYHAPSTVVASSSTVTFSQSHICYKILTHTMLPDIVCYFGIS